MLYVYLCIATTYLVVYMHAITQLHVHTYVHTYLWLCTYVYGYLFDFYISSYVCTYVHNFICHRVTYFWKCKILRLVTNLKNMFG